ncbi:hypothetical protein Hypma_007295 [Hypsizygus marmoreus]|uniref:Uncharacterized protein n=1 Tax=Hypsizygus marmoreus TaxID=39966 RepID=A0A369KAJ3_HYPMA|nr:hypothetical protein Hypma_007295 [Hypsizygus marmoreus]
MASPAAPPDARESTMRVHGRDKTCPAKVARLGQQDRHPLPGPNKAIYGASATSNLEGERDDGHGQQGGERYDNGGEDRNLSTTSTRTHTRTDGGNNSHHYISTSPRFVSPSTLEQVHEAAAVQSLLCPELPVSRTCWFSNLFTVRKQDIFEMLWFCRHWGTGTG